MNKRNELVKHLRTDEDKYLVFRMLDKVDMVLKDHRVSFTDFLDPHQISVGTQILNKIDNISYTVNGIIDSAERKIIIVYPKYLEKESIEVPINVIKFTGDFNKEDISHRDILGSILGLGVKREKIGDIYINKGHAYIIAYKEINEYIALYMDKVSKYKVIIEEISSDEINRVEENYKLIYSTIPSLRLDVVLSAGFGVSRSSLSKKMNNDRVKVNWKPINQSSYTLSPGDMISFRGMGRIQLLEVNGKSKKDRLKVVIKRFL